MKRLLPILLLPLLVWALLCPVWAEDAAIEQLSGGYDIAIPADWTLEELVQYFRDAYGLDEHSFAISLYCPTTGERFSFNDTTQFFAASTYKLPLNMYYYERQDEGVYTGDTLIDGVPLSTCHYQSIVYSDNTLSQAMIYNLGSFYQYKLLMLDSYGDMPLSELDANYWGDNYYCTKFMGNTLEYLYTHQDRFGELLDYMKQAMPGQYLKTYAGDVEIAHKYGIFYDPVAQNDVGILFTEDPLLVAVYTSEYYAPGVDGEELIGRIGKALINYQTQRTALDRLAAEQAAIEAAAIQESLEEEQARQESEAAAAAAAEQARLAAEQAAQEQAAEAASAAAAEQARQVREETARAAAAEAAARQSKIILLAAGVAVAAILLAAVKLLLGKKR